MASRRTATACTADPDGSLVDAVRARLEEMLASGRFPPGSRLPPERELAEIFQVNRLTVNKALGRFVDAGRLTRRVGSGTWVCERDPARALAVVDVFLPHNERVGEGASAMLGRPGVAEGVHDYFRDRPVRMALAFYRSDQELADRLDRVLEQEDAAQVVWYRPSTPACAALRRLAARGRAFCLVDCREPSEDWNLVASDHFQGGLLAAEAVAAAGRRRIAYLTQAAGAESLAERAKGLACGAARARLELVERTVADAAAVAAAVDDLLAAGGSDALAASNDWIALAALAALRARGVAVPEAVSVVGYDDIEEGRYSAPALATVSQDFYAIGFRAAEVVDRAWREPGGGRRVQLVGPRLVARASLRPT